MKNVNFVALSEICTLEKGKTGLMKALPGKYPLVATGKDRRTCDTYQFDTKAVCVPLVSSTGHGHASLKYVHYQEGKFALGTILVAVIPKDENVLNAQFLHLYLSRLKDEILVPLMTGAANVTLTVTKLKTVKVPLPPIGEQLRIVSLFNRMDNEQAELTNEITNQQELLKKLRQSILQEAIEGKLTASWREQNPDIENASMLLEKIKAEKEQLIKNKKIKNQKPIPPISKDELPFNIPNSWEWILFCEVCYYEQGIQIDAHMQLKQMDRGLIRFLRIVDFTQETNEIRYIKDPGDKYHMSENELVMVRYGASAGFVGSNKKGVLANNLFKIKYGNLNLRYLEYFFISNYFKYILKDHARGVAMPAISFKFLDLLNFPLPPIKEQKEIVKKIENLFSICDELEEQINSSKMNSEILMQAVLKEAFEG